MTSVIFGGSSLKRSNTSNRKAPILPACLYSCFCRSRQRNFSHFPNYNSHFSNGRNLAAIRSSRHAPGLTASHRVTYGRGGWQSSLILWPFLCLISSGPLVADKNRLELVYSIREEHGDDLNWSSTSRPGFLSHVGAVADTPPVLNYSPSPSRPPPN